MNCSKTQDLLSSHYDRELPVDISRAVRSHLDACPECAERLAGFEQLSAAASGLRRLRGTAPPAGMWEKFEQQLDGAPTRFAGLAGRLPIHPAALAVAATLLVAVALGGLGLYLGRARNADAESAAIIARYFEQFPSSPSGAQQILRAQYEGQSIDVQDSINHVGYTPVVAGGLPPGYLLDSVHVWKMPCCKCVQCLCKRADGTTVVVFEHQDQPDWFGGRPATTLDCDGRQCSVVQLDNQLAVSWKHGNRHLTVVGVRDVGEVAALVQSLSGQVAER